MLISAIRNRRYEKHVQAAMQGEATIKGRVMPHELVDKVRVGVGNKRMAGQLSRKPRCTMLIHSSSDRNIMHTAVLRCVFRSTTDWPLGPISHSKTTGAKESQFPAFSHIFRFFSGGLPCEVMGELSELELQEAQAQWNDLVAEVKVLWRVTGDRRCVA